MLRFLRFLVIANTERSDGGDLLALCQENLVFRCDLVEGVRKELLAPFHYFGVSDEVDYRNIPWRAGRFDEESLTNAVATQERAQNALEQLRLRGGSRTLAFCCSVRHADFMRRYFAERGVRSAAVHSDGGTSDPRASSLEKLEKGELDVVFAVDMFNEGVDLPHIDTVLMLRPTESKILWLQQFGRGLRRAAGKSHLNVIDYVGNHRTFLLGLQTLFALPTGDTHVQSLLTKLRDGAVELPPGCEVTYDLKAIDIIRSLLRTGGSDVARAFYEDFRETHGSRPTASELHHEGLNIGALRKHHGSWFGFVGAMGDLDPLQQALTREGRSGAFLEVLETTAMTKSFKMLILLAMLNANQLPGEMSLEELRDGVRRLALRSTALRQDFGNRLDDDGALAELLKENPIAAWVGGEGTGGVAYFEYAERKLRTTFEVDSEQGEAFCELARELAEWRLVQYLDRPSRGVSEHGAAHRIVCKVNHRNGSPIVFPLQREKNPDLPSGWGDLTIDGEDYEANFAKVAVNVVRRRGSTENVLPELLREWFGQDAGLPGTRHHVALETVDGKLRMSPAALVLPSEGLQVGRLYLRSEIPEAFGLVFNPAIWNKGFIPQGGRLFLLVTLEKSGKPKEHQYGDRFISREVFEWKSQNRTRQASAAGQSIRLHQEKGTPVHLFARRARDRFVYCGEVGFSDWEGDRPITVRWQLREPLSDRTALLLGVA